MITTSFNLTATERVLPKLALDFTTAALDSRVTFTRTTGASNPATYTNSSGVITAATNNQPRFDYDSVTLACKGLLIEESRANVLTYSDQFNDASWTKTNTSVSADASTSPDGTSNADQVTEGVGLQTQFAVSKGFSAAGTTAYTVSCYIKRAVGSLRGLRLEFGAAASGFRANFNPDTGAVTSQSAYGTATVTNAVSFDCGNGWRRYVVSGVTGAAAIYTTYLRFTESPTSATIGYTGDGVQAYYYWGAQLEAGAFATSYIPTTSAALTRNADVATMTGTNFSSWFNQSEGAFELEYSRIANGVAGKFPYAAYVFQDAQNRIDFYQNATTNDVVTVKTANVNVASFARSVVGANVTVNQVLAYKTNSFAFASGGLSVSTSSSGNLPSPTVLYIGGINSTGFELNGHMKKINYWPLRITNSEVQSFSK